MLSLENLHFAVSKILRKLLEEVFSFSTATKICFSSSSTKYCLCNTFEWANLSRSLLWNFTDVSKQISGNELSLLPRVCDAYTNVLGSLCRQSENVAKKGQFHSYSVF